MEYRNRCEICKSQDYNIYTTDYDYLNIRILKCKKCGFIYVNPIPTFDAIKNQNIYTFDEFDKIYIKNYLIKEPIFFQILSLINKKEGRLLDVGCNLGYFLDIAKEHGYCTTGVDINPDFLEYVKSRGHHVSCNSLRDNEDKIKIESDYFDVVTMLEVLEHVQYPGKVLKEIKRVLKYNGLLIIEVPNVIFHLFKGKFERLTKKNVVGLSPTHHYNHFTDKTLKSFLEREGFYLLGIYVGNPASIALLGYSKIIKLFNYALQQFLRLTFKLTGVHLGSRIIAVAKKA